MAARWTALSMAAACLVCLPASAGAPAIKQQAPGYYRMMLGDFEVTALSDGTMDLAVNKLLKGLKPEDIDGELAVHALKSPLETSYNAYLVNTGAKLVLIDTGASNLLGPTLGRLNENLRAAGYTPEQVDEVYVTHLHGDHMGGLVRNGQRVFPNAIVRVHQADADHWLSEEKMNAAPAALKVFYKNARDCIGPYQAAGRLSTFSDNAQLVPGITAVLTRGHTPGHSLYQVESRGERMWVLGDMLHVAAVQFRHPLVGIQFDSDSGTAGTARAALYEDAAASKAILAVSHISFPGLGRLQKTGQGYVWLPVNYSALR